MYASQWTSLDTSIENMVFHSMEEKEKGFNSKTASRLLQFPPLRPTPNTAFPKLRFRASRAVNHVDDEQVFSRDAAMSGKILVVAAADSS